MNFLIVGIGLSWLIVTLIGWLGWQLLRQNGRMLLRLEELERRLDEFQFGELDAEPQSREKEPADRNHVSSTSTNGESDRASRFNNRSLARSKIKRDGLKAGQQAPDFRLPCLDGTERSLADFHGRRVLLVFSDPHCGPCNQLAPRLEQFHQASADVVTVMISRGEPKENRAKANEHGLSFPILLQQQWEISRRYAMFATPIAYLIDEGGVIERNVALGVDSILALMADCKTARIAADARP
jgi:peroxiredoxin